MKPRASVENLTCPSPQGNRFEWAGLNCMTQPVPLVSYGDFPQACPLRLRQDAITQCSWGRTGSSEARTSKGGTPTRSARLREGALPNVASSGTAAGKSTER
jgi:hypothetical protein